MNISYKWIKEYIDCDFTPEQMADVLTSIGLEVASIEEVPAIRGGLRGLYVGRVVSCIAHPDSSHLHVTTVDLGRDTPAQIVCGAPNVAAGKKVIVADLGCILYDGDKEFVIRKSKLRGVESYGMICAEDEIGIGTSHDGIIILPDDAPVGQPAAEYYHLESDWVIEIDITANRADALSHYGVARDLYAWMVQHGYPTRLHRPTCDDFHVADHSLPIEVTICNTEACPRYACVSITGCHVGESPDWLKRHLTTIGLRPINNIVDITNYIMFAYGQPLHCFDADMIEGRHIIVRADNEGQSFMTLDGNNHILGPHDLAICNSREPMCIAGVFGGRGSGTYDTTTRVVLESAYFHPTWIRKSARRHGLSTDASFRFERGTDPDGVLYALKQAAILCCQLAGGKVSMDIRDEYPMPIAPARVVLRYDYVDRLIGKQLGAETIRRIVTALDMTIEDENDDGLTLTIPGYRVDVKRPCDVVEDILRIYGYNNVELPEHLCFSPVIQRDDDHKYKLENLVGEQLVGCGFHEILNNSLTPARYYDDMGEPCPPTRLVHIMNPLSTDLNVMRQTLLFGGLETIRRNVNRQCPNLRLYEFGNCYSHDERISADNDPVRPYPQHACLGLWLAGKSVQGSWAHPDEAASIYQLKAYVENILQHVGLPLTETEVLAVTDTRFDHALEYRARGGASLVRLGIVGRNIRKCFDLSTDVFFAEIHWSNLYKRVRGRKVEIRDISKYPAVSRDLALLLDSHVTFAQVEQVARQAERKFLKRVELFDVYEGKNLPDGKKSYAVNFILRDDQHTMNDKLIESIMAKLIDQLKKQLGAQLR